MAISALPETTIVLLGAAQVITNPASLVKELIDNALDAKATNVDIVISQNTIDKIEIRDNGHGIQFQDLDALGRRGHTSKLRSFEELRFLGGRSLGFRGEALFSAVQLGEVSITTRTEGESVANTVKLRNTGGIDRQSRTSHPIGTTVSVTALMAKLPVRKQTALKEAPKTLAKIKELIQAYALARYTVKFSFKVIKGNKSAWTFAPRPNDGIKEAVAQVSGREAAIQCTETSLEFPGPQLRVPTGENDVGDSSSSDQVPSGRSNGCFLIEAYLPRPDADPSKFGNGQFLSIDSRPVSHEKGTMKKTVSLFKKYLKSALAESSSEKLKNPFLRLNISCPEASYDPNVEPAKDDVLFENESLVLSSIEKLFINVYGECKIATASGTALLAKKLDGFELLLARKPLLPPLETVQPVHEANSKQPPPAAMIVTSPAISPVSGSAAASESLEDRDVQEDGDWQSGPKKRQWRVDMSEDFTESVDVDRDGFNPPRTSNIRRTADVASSSKTSLNPWIIAKMNAPIQERRLPDTPKNATSSAGATPSPINHTSRPSFHGPAFSGSEVVSSSSSHDATAQDCLIHADQLPAPIQDRQIDDFEDLLDTSSQMNQPPGPIEGQHYYLSVISPRTNRPAPTNDFVSARKIADLAESIIPPPPPRVKGPPKSRGSNRLFVSPLKGPVSINEPNSPIQTNLLEFRPSLAQDDIPQALPRIETNPNAAWAMDFEHRKESATRRLREELRLAKDEFEESPPQNIRSPHKNRYNAAIARLELPEESPRKPLRESGSETQQQSLKISLHPRDPRAYLMRRQKSVAAQSGSDNGPRKMKRMKTSLLPLETIPTTQEIQDLLQDVKVDVEDVRRVMDSISKDDAYVGRGNITRGLEMGPNEVPAFALTLKDVVQKWIDAKKEECEVEFNFTNLGQGDGLLIA